MHLDHDDLSVALRKLIKYLGGGTATVSLGTPTSGQCFPGLNSGGTPQSVTVPITGTVSIPFGSSLDVKVYKTDAAGNLTNTGATITSTSTGLQVTLTAAQHGVTTAAQCVDLLIIFRAFNSSASPAYTTIAVVEVQVCGSCSATPPPPPSPPITVPPITVPPITVPPTFPPPPPEPPADFATYAAEAPAAKPKGKKGK